MPCERKARVRHNTIAFWLSDEERKEVDARIALSGLQKGEYYRSAILGQEVHVVAGNYMSVRVAKDLEQILELMQNGTVPEDTMLVELIRQLLIVSGYDTDRHELSNTKCEDSIREGESNE